MTVQGGGPLVSEVRRPERLDHAYWFIDTESGPACRPALTDSSSLYNTYIAGPLPSCRPGRLKASLAVPGPRSASRSAVLIDWRSLLPSASVGLPAVCT